MADDNQKTYGNQDWGIGVGAAALGAGLVGSIFNMGKGAKEYGVYDPTESALGRYNELINPDSNYNKRMQGLFARYFAEGSPTINTLLGVSKAGGMDSSSATALAFQQSRAIASQNNERVLNAFQEQMLRGEQTATGYLGLHYNMLQNQQNLQARADLQQREDSTSFFDQLLGVGGGILSKLLI